MRVLLTGEISDELFGYKYTDYAPTADAFQQESQKRIRELYMYDVPVSYTHLDVYKRQIFAASTASRRGSTRWRRLP